MLAPTVERHGNLPPTIGQASPITSDEEYLSPLEEFPESGTPQHRPAMKLQPRAEHGAAHGSPETTFKSAPTFEVRQQLPQDPVEGVQCPVTAALWSSVPGDAGSGLPTP